MSYFLENEEVEKVEEVKEQDGIASIEPLLDNRIVRAIREMGFEKLSPIQEQAIPYLLQGEDIIGQAQTGTGKTAAFGIPAIQHINPDVKKLQTIILCPTRELAIQAAEELRKIAKYMHGIKVLPVYGGQDISRQIAGLRGVQIIVGTPGRVMDHMRRRTIKLDLVNMVVLDEADEMLNMGFVEDVEEIMSHTSDERRVLLFSATMPERIIRLSKTYMRDTEIVRVEHKQITADLTEQIYFEVREADKFDALTRIIDVEPEFYGIVFSRTRTGADDIVAKLLERGYAAEVLHDPVEDTPQIPRPHDQYPGGYRRGRPGHRRGQPDPRHQLLAAAGFRQLCPPHRTHGARERNGPRDHLRQRKGAGQVPPHRNFHGAGCGKIADPRASGQRPRIQSRRKRPPLFGPRRPRTGRQPA